MLLVLVPGLACLRAGRRKLGWGIFLGYVLGVLFCVAGLGYAWGSLGLGLAVSLHALSLTSLQQNWFGNTRLGVRFGLALCTLLAVWAVFYRPLLGYAERHWLVPLRTEGQVIVVRRGVASGELKRGDWVAYRIRAQTEGSGEESINLRAGFGLEPVLGLPGDRLRFSSNCVWVNESSFARAAHMPSDGELVVPEKRWFIWPNVEVNRGGVPEANLSEVLLRTALVSDEQLVGRPYRHWFGRRQWPSGD